jgi:hypothetical protein
MRQQRYPIPPFWTYLLATAASLTLFLPAAISMNSAALPLSWEKFRQTLSTPEVSQHRMEADNTVSYSNPLQLPVVEQAADPKEDEIHSAAPRKTKGSLSLQTAAIIGSSAAVAAANFIRQGTQASSYPLQK